MADLRTQRITIMAGDEGATTTKEFHTASDEGDKNDNAASGVPYAHSYALEVFGNGSANFTLAIQGKPHVSGTYTAIDYYETGKAGASATANSQLTVNDTTHRFYVIPNSPPFVQTIATRSAGELTIYASLTSNPYPQHLLTTARGAVLVEGAVAHDAVEAGQSIMLGGKADTGVPGAVADADHVDAWFDERGRQGVFIGEAGSSIESVGIVNPGNGTAAPSRVLGVGAFLEIRAPDGAYDVMQSVGDTAGSGQGALSVSPTGHAHNSVTGDEQILSAAGKLHTVSVHDITTGGTLTIYDNTAETGTVIATLALAAGEGFVTLHYDVSCASGLYMGYDSNLVGAFTVSYSV